MLGQEQDCLGGCLEPHQALDGMVDELAIYDRALSEAEISAIFDAREAGKCKPPSKADLLQEIDDLLAETAGLESEVVGLESELVGLESEVLGLESEVETLLGRIVELEAAAGQQVQHPCGHSYRQRGCERGDRHQNRRHRRPWRRWGQH